jgi:hypothetical protein
LARFSLYEIVKRGKDYHDRGGFFMKPGMINQRNEEVAVYKMDSTSQCPLVARRYDECYCNNMTSQKISSVVHYCMRNFEACEIYKRKIAREDGHESDPESSAPEAIQHT